MFPLKMQADPNMPQDSIRLENPDGSTALLITNIGKPDKVLQPTSFWSPSMEKRKKEQGIAASLDQVTTNDGWHEKFRTPPNHPSLLMMRLGYTRNPATCTHERKRLTEGAERWRCKDCGDWM